MSTANTNGAVVSAGSAKIPAVAHPLAEEPDEIASNINYHAAYSPHFSLFKFEPEQAYYATAESVRDRLVQVRFLTLLTFLVRNDLCLGRIFLYEMIYIFFC